MKAAYSVKIIDLAGQIAIGLIVAMSTTILTGYCVFGAMQLVSCILNKVLLDEFVKDNGRRVYEVIVAMLALAVCAGVFPVLSVIGFVSPLLALLYINISVRELYRLRRLSRRHFF